MFSRIHRQLGTAGLIVSIVALVAALAGGAYAANGGLNKQQKKQVRNISKNEAKKLIKKSGTSGPAGPAGPQGAQGTPGAPGNPGAAGADGKDGTNGKDGKDGKEGSPWTAGGVLPSGSTETGAWAYGPGEGPAYLPIGFAIPLPGELAAADVHYMNPAGKEVIVNGLEETEEVTSTACLGTAAAPLATDGDLCIYAGGQPETLITNSARIFKIGGTEPFDPGASTAGARLLVVGEGSAWGTFAVTAP